MEALLSPGQGWFHHTCSSCCLFHAGCSLTDGKSAPVELSGVALLSSFILAGFSATNMTAEDENKSLECLC